MKSICVASLVFTTFATAPAHRAHAASAPDLAAYCAPAAAFDQIDGFKGPLPPNLCAMIKDAQLTPQKVDRALSRQPRMARKEYTPRQLADRQFRFYQRRADEDAGGPREGEDLVRATERKRAELFRRLKEVIG